MAEFTLRTQAQSKVARQFPLLIQAQAAAHFAVGEVIPLGLQAEVAQRIFPQHAGVETCRW